MKNESKRGEESRASVKRGKSQYRKKLRAKFGRGKPQPQWMWWMARGDA